MSENVLPFYLVCDESASMDSVMDELNDGLGEAHQAIGSNPIVADKTRFGIIGFADDAEVLLPLADVSELTGFPLLRRRGMTNYADAFRSLKDTITDDVAALKADGHRVYRPAVFFLSDGQPSRDDWRPSYQDLISPSFACRPNVIAFGFGTVDPDTISEVGTFAAFIAEQGTRPGDAINEFASALTKSILSSGVSMTKESFTLQVPEQVPGFTALPVDVL